MKLSKIFKKTTSTALKTNIEKLEKNQLNTIIGGTETTDATAIDTTTDASRMHDMSKSIIQNIRA